MRQVLPVLLLGWEMTCSGSDSKRNSSLFNSLTSEREKDEEQIFLFFFVLSLFVCLFVLYGTKHSGILAYFGSFSVLTVSQTVLSMLLLSTFKNSGVGFKYVVVPPPKFLSLVDSAFRFVFFQLFSCSCGV